MDAVQDVTSEHKRSPTIDDDSGMDAVADSKEVISQPHNIINAFVLLIRCSGGGYKIRRHSRPSENERTCDYTSLRIKSLISRPTYDRL